MGLLFIEILSGISMYYFDFPFGTQTIHVVIAPFYLVSILFNFRIK
jgi:cytochrome b subunit of formate dehydrogenase